ncbi:zinc ABC transporter substrate-binding protein [Roseivivax sp.]
MSMTRLAAPLALACLASPVLADAPSVAVDIAPAHALVARVMEGVGRPDLVIPSGASPHGYNLRPSEARALQEADLVVWTGPALTPWLSEALGTLAGDARRLELFEVAGTLRLETRSGALFEAHDHGDHGEEGHEGHGHDDHDEHGEHDDHSDHDGHEHAEHAEHEDGHAHDHEGHDDHAEDEAGHKDDAAQDDHGHDDRKEAEGHDHDAHAEAEDHGHDHAPGSLDPHGWLAPENAALWLGAIAEALSEVDPENAETYRANAEAGQGELATLETEIAQILAPRDGAPVIVFHDAYQYFEESFGLNVVGAISISDATPPSPARIAEIQARITEADVTCVLSEPQFNPGIVSTVLEGTEAGTAVLDPLGAHLDAGAALYPALLRDMARSLADCG